MIVVDASIASAWFLEEKQSELATALLHQQRELIAPDVMAAEVGSALVRAFRRKLVTSEEAANGLSAIVAGLVTLHASAPLLVEACHLACRLRCSIYDATYIELARRTDALIVTDDARMAEMARSIPVRVHRPDDGPLPD